MPGGEGASWWCQEGWLKPVSQVGRTERGREKVPKERGRQTGEPGSTGRSCLFPCSPPPSTVRMKIASALGKKPLQVALFLSGPCGPCGISHCPQHPGAAQGQVARSSSQGEEDYSRRQVTHSFKVTHSPVTQFLDLTAGAKDTVGKGRGGAVGPELRSMCSHLADGLRLI